ncbi:hypothetical protein BDQ94DRAFT_139503 [Aspergillus welwitschiae]|uniref:Uncharacterized protein n=1 Tax=Aspergillus welwitschiae TaxID=1341132 RepID=A0A3F3QA10_9EURO|nr:hypothetical protein BDQ94DRAFT_139503 [Aspergillus welwitschiae]RDH35993.1 hypothetical protein BDQ94DRAFT_139503 [Aspergillus welwitschiae]
MSHTSNTGLLSSGRAPPRDLTATPIIRRSELDSIKHETISPSRLSPMLGLPWTQSWACQESDVGFKVIARLSTSNRGASRTKSS